MSYNAPITDIAHALIHAADLEKGMNGGLYSGLEQDLVEAVLVEAGKFASERLAPLNAPADRFGAVVKDGVVTTAPGFRDVYKDWTEAGWNSIAAHPDFGGQGLPFLLSCAVMEMWNAACCAFSLCPVLTQGAIEAIAAHGSDQLKAVYLPKMVSGQWSGTMNLTEPQAGSDLAALRTKAERAGDGAYKITGQKIFITWGEHDCAENIIHLVLARLPDAPAGTKGISLFLVPKFLVNADGTLGARNDVRCHSLEHKLGINASPTCTMVYGDKGGAIGYLIGEENRGLMAMFTMMNNARINVGLQGVAVAERATQQAFAYARERKQGRSAGAASFEMEPIIVHPDVKRNLMTMKAATQAARAICYITAAAIDQAHLGADEATRKAGDARASLLTPIAKSFATDMANEVASIGVQVHGGMGFIEETGAAQHMRDSRIFAIYEGTNGIQAIDLVTRKLPMQNGEVALAEIATMRALVDQVKASNNPAFGRTAEKLGQCLDHLQDASAFLFEAMQNNRMNDALAGATPYQRLFGLAVGGAALVKQALGTPDDAERVQTARFFAENLAVQSGGLHEAVVHGAQSVLDLA